MDIKQLLQKGVAEKKQNKKFLQQLNNKKTKNLDDNVQQAHDEVFEQLDCLTCANCCKTTSPIFYDKDIERVAKFLRLKSAEFIDKYLRIDEDNDYVLKSSPCPFLLPDNYCEVYEHRPKACREYPHTDRKNFYQLTDLTYKNTLVCPAVVAVVDKLKKVYA